MQIPLWLVYAILAALCAAMINIFGKIGLKGINSDLATAIRSIVQAAFVVSFAAIAGVFGKHMSQLHGNTKAYLSIVAGGVLGGLSWIFVFRAIQASSVSKVAPIDKLSMPISILLAALLLGERPTGLNWTGIGLIIVGAYMASYAKA